MRMRTKLLLLSSLLLPASAAAQERATCEALRITSPEAKGDLGDVPSFSATRILDLELQVIFPEGPTAVDRVEIVVRTPRGHLYQRIMVPIAAGEAKGRTRSVNGYPHPLPVKGLQPIIGAGGARRLGVVIRFPVAGTSIIKNGLYGRWRIEAHAGGRPEACAKAVVDLRP